MAVNFFDGKTNDKSKAADYFVCCVRGGQENNSMDVGRGKKAVVENKEGRDKYITVIGNKMWQDRWINKEITMNWRNAVSYCNNLELEGYDDWRLPSKEILKEVYGSKSEFINFSSCYYWSSTANPHSREAWIVYYHDGNADKSDKVLEYCIRCVRGGLENNSVDVGRRSETVQDSETAKTIIEDKKYITVIGDKMWQDMPINKTKR